MLRNPALDERTGGTILIKPETLQRTGSFKLRGATNAALQLAPEQRRAGRGDALLRQSRPGARLRRRLARHARDHLHARRCAAW